MKNIFQFYKKLSLAITRQKHSYTKETQQYPKCESNKYNGVLSTNTLYNPPLMLNWIPIILYTLLTYQQADTPLKCEVEMNNCDYPT